MIMNKEEREKQIYKALAARKNLLIVEREEIKEKIINKNEDIENAIKTQYNKGRYDAISEELNNITNLIERKLKHYEQV